jgi:uncharacterized phage protein (TIGR01671 family)
MREILFRGKREENDVWIWGGFNSRDGKAYIIGMPKQGRIDGIEVDPKTLGQYTGLTDKNGTKIFEGDIVRRYDNVERVFYDGGGFSPFAIPGWECTPDADEVEVIGNIHDNPELLTEK